MFVDEAVSLVLLGRVPLQEKARERTQDDAYRLFAQRRMRRPRNWFDHAISGNRARSHRSKKSRKSNLDPGREPSRLFERIALGRYSLWSKRRPLKIENRRLWQNRRRWRGGKRHSVYSDCATKSQQTARETRMKNKLDFKDIARTALSHALSICERLLPGGKLRNREWVSGNLRGDPGESLSVNTQTGRWADFATEKRGGDLISLVAAVHGLTQLEAAERLSVMLGIPSPTKSGGSRGSRGSAPRKPAENRRSRLAKPAAMARRIGQSSIHRFAALCQRTGGGTPAHE